MPELSDPAAPTAILIVHGIGAQSRGETLVKLVAGLRRVDPEFAKNGYEGTLMFCGRPVRLYEVYWADLTMGKLSEGSFEINEAQSLAWFPCMNARRGNYDKGRYSLIKLAGWLVALPIINYLILLSYFGAGLAAQMVSIIFKKDEDREPAGRFFKKIRAAADSAAKLTDVDRILDEYPGDVISYINSAGDGFHSDGKKGAVTEERKCLFFDVMDRFYEQLSKAKSDGCGAIHVVAHSLGTVVAYHAVTGFRFDINDGGRPRADAEAIRSAAASVKHIYTIGSPLEKIRFFWPKLAPARPPLAHTNVSIPWDNFVSRFDPVAGILYSFGDWANITNHRLLGGGFLSGHIVYERSAVFLGVLTREVSGRDVPMSRSRGERVRDTLLLFAETLAAPLALALVLIMGAAISLLTAMLIPIVLSLVLSTFMNGNLVQDIKGYLGGFFIAMFVLVFTINPPIRACKVHSRYWMRTKPE
ncbi:MAG: hypothetical protein HY286_10495 [Planctomycetes bacterium]|nr:hypothetical protein [Planctomycetota bacterium]